jgi:7-cyano-7-deazaguanine synthase
VKEGTRPGSGIRVLTPLIHLKKHQIVGLGRRLSTPFELSWSCYQSSDKACGVCDSCRLRLKGFGEAGVKDPLPYKSAR